MILSIPIKLTSRTSSPTACVRIPLVQNSWVSQYLKATIRVNANISNQAIILLEASDTVVKHIVVPAKEVEDIIRYVDIWHQSAEISSYSLVIRVAYQARCMFSILVER